MFFSESASVIKQAQNNETVSSNNATRRNVTCMQNGGFSCVRCK